MLFCKEFKALEANAEKISKTLSVQTALGEITVTVTLMGTGISTAQITLTKHQVPPEDNVRNCQAVLCKIKGTKQINKILFTASIDSKLIGDPCTGEHLEATEWEDVNSLVVVGTEDAEALNARMPFLKLEDYASIATYRASSLRIELREIEPSHDLGLHFVVAENPSPEPVACSAWFAVDCSHPYLDLISSAQSK